MGVQKSATTHTVDGQKRQKDHLRWLNELVEVPKSHSAAWVWHISSRQQAATCATVLLDCCCCCYGHPSCCQTAQHMASRCKQQAGVSSPPAEWITAQQFGYLHCSTLHPLRPPPHTQINKTHLHSCASCAARPNTAAAAGVLLVLVLPRRQSAPPPRARPNTCSQPHLRSCASCAALPPPQGHSGGAVLPGGWPGPSAQDCNNSNTSKPCA